MKICGDCNKIINLTDIKFCPFCGSINIRNFFLGKVIPQDKVVLIVKATTSKTIQSAISMMKEQLGYFELGTKDLKYICVAYEKGHEIDAAEIILRLQPRLNFILYENGIKRTSPSFLTEPYRCVLNRNNNQHPEEHCYGLDYSPNIVGCRHMGLELPTYYWLHFLGYYEDPFGNYRYDKSSMSHKIIATAKRYRCCPYMNSSAARRFVDAWPERINVFIDKRFRQVPTDYFNIGVIRISDFDIGDDGEIHKINDSPPVLRGDVPGRIMPPVPVEYDFYKELLRRTYPDHNYDSVNFTAEHAISFVLATVERLKQQTD